MALLTPTGQKGGGWGVPSAPCVSHTIYALSINTISPPTTGLARLCVMVVLCVGSQDLVSVGLLSKMAHDLRHHHRLRVVFSFVPDGTQPGGSALAAVQISCTRIR
jgi:hypothetical protein